MPLHVEKICNQFLTQLKNSGQFKASERVTLYRSFGPSKTKVFWDWPNQMRKIEMSNADRAYGWLGVLSAQQVLPIWERSKLPYYEIQLVPSQLLDLAKGILLGTTDADKILEFRWLDDFRLDLMIQENVYYALEAACAALNTLFYGLAGLVGDFATAASKAYALNIENDALGNEVKIPRDPYYKHSKNKIDPIKEVEFWEWWLSEAVPKAWQLTQEMDNNL